MVFLDDSLGLKSNVSSRSQGSLVVALLILSGETKVTGEDVLDINRDGVFAQTTVSLDLLTAVAKVEVKYLVIFSKTKEKKWTPWEKMELYKSEQ